MKITVAAIKINDISRIWNGWKQFLEELDKTHEISLIGNGKDGDYYNNNIAVYGRIRLLFGKTSIREVFSLIKNSDIFVGGETGLSHVAVFFNIPTVMIFQEYDAFFRASHLNFNNVKAMFRPSVEEVIKIINEKH